MTDFKALLLCLLGMHAYASHHECADIFDDLTMHPGEDLSLLQKHSKAVRSTDVMGVGANATVASPSPPTGAVLSVKLSSDTGYQIAATGSSSVKFSAFMAEYIAMTLFVVIGCGSAMAIAKEEGSAWVFQVSLTFGLAITTLAYAIGHYSGGQINCAVTLGLVLTGQCSVAQGILNFVAQMLGSVTGAVMLLGVFPKMKDRTGGLGANTVGEGWSTRNALMGEFLMTFLLVFVVLETATNPQSEANRAQAPVAIGFAVFLAHSVLIPIDGCSINPTRSFGPAIVARALLKSGKPISDMWVFWVGPLLGAAAAAGVSAGLMS